MMSDLISRAAAIDAIDGMKPMRGNMEQLAMKALCWAAVKSIPAVDAIPVEWIMSWSNKRYRETQKDVLIVDVLEAWQKSQEAR